MIGSLPFSAEADLFLDRVLRDEPEDLDDLRLTDAVRPRDGLDVDLCKKGRKVRSRCGDAKDQDV